MNFQLNLHSDPAYHLRPNKAVDRLILVDAVRALDRLQLVDDSSYIGFGGPYLEDIKLFLAHFPRLSLVSIEEDEDRYKRQLFHKCSKNITLVRSKFSEYLDNGFPSGTRTIVWQDATEMSKATIDEFVTVCRNSAINSLLRLTIPASPPQWARGFRTNAAGIPLEKANRLFDEHFPTYRAKFGEFIPSSVDISAIDVVEPKFYAFLAGMLRTAINDAFPPYGTRRFLPINNSVYSDGAPMLSVTGVISTVDEEKGVKRHFKKYFPYYSGDWNKIDFIDVPRLSVKERLAIEANLPTKKPTGKTVKKALRYRIGRDETDHLHKCHQYERYFSLYPYYGKIIP